MNRISKFAFGALVIICFGQSLLLCICLAVREPPSLIVPSQGDDKMRQIALELSEGPLTVENRSPRWYVFATSCEKMYEIASKYGTTLICYDEKYQTEAFKLPPIPRKSEELLIYRPEQRLQAILPNNAVPHEVFDLCKPERFYVVDFKNVSSGGRFSIVQVVLFPTGGPTSFDGIAVAYGL